MTIRPTSRQFSLRPESELLVWCARTVVTDALKARIRQRVQESIDWGIVLDLAGIMVLAHCCIEICQRSVPTWCPPNRWLGYARGRKPVPYSTGRSPRNSSSCARRLPRMECRSRPSKGRPWLCRRMALTLRDFGDLDLLVPKGSIAEAQAVLLAQGYERKNPSSEPGETDHEEGPYHVFIKKRTLFRVDLQWVMAHQHFVFQLDRPEFWKSRTPVPLANKTVQGMAPENLLIVLCVHGSKHAWESLKWVCDVAELLRAHQRHDRERILSSASDWRCRRLVYMGLSLAHRLLDAPLPEAVQARLSADSDVQMFSHRMPATLLANHRAGVNEEQAAAFYFSLKDSWLDRWRLGLMLCRDQSPMVTTPPAWFRWRTSLPRLARVVHPLHRTLRSLFSSTIRGAINRWVEHGG